VNKPKGTASIRHDGQVDASSAQAGEDDRELVARCKAGDRNAFRQLFVRYHRRAFGLAISVVHNKDNAADVVQEAFLKAHKHLDSFEGNASFYTWLYRIVMNVAIDHLRKHQRSPVVDFDESVAHGDEEGGGEDSILPQFLGANPAKELQRKEIREKLELALAKLSPNHRAVLVMREVDGLSYEEMSKVMKCSKGTIMSRLFHARKYMQKHLLELLGPRKDHEV
jgi:RNA polymerase sigma-70 factor (ECF subfamily)